MTETIQVPPFGAIITEKETADALREIARERARQRDLFPEQVSLPDGTSPAAYTEDAEYARWECDCADVEGRVTRRHILMEEVYEALAESDPVKLRTELIQVAACATAWIEDIDRRVQNASTSQQSADVLDAVG